MRQETKTRIEGYKSYLPKVATKILSAAVMFALALILMVSTTFAWITLSTNPEAAKIATTVAANGNLEIALEDGDSDTVPTSGRGDSSARDNDLVRSNITWGNLINLSAEEYGLANISLRPALLNEYELTSNPLSGAFYGTDGRVSGLDSDYTFAKWDSEGRQFIASDEKGVRSISAYIYAVSESTNVAVRETLSRLKKVVTNAEYTIGEKFKNDVMSDSNLNGLKGLLNTYIEGAINDYVDKKNDPESDPHNAEDTDITEYLGQMYNLYNEFYNTMLIQQQAYTALANYQRYVYSVSNSTAFEDITWNDIVENAANYNASSPDNVSADGIVSLTGLSLYLTDLATASADRDILASYIEENQATGATYKYEDINNIVYHLASPTTALVGGKPIDEIDTDSLMSVLADPKIIISQGLLKDFEQIAVQSKNRMDVSMTFHISGVSRVLGGESDGSDSVDLTVNVKTAVNPSSIMSYVDNDTLKTSKSVNIAAGDRVATDSYGLAFDFWVRTNAKDTYLVLEGKTIVEDTTVRERGWDGDGNAVDLFSASVTEGGNTSVIDVYQRNNKWYKANTNTEVTPNGDPTPKSKTVTTVTGYEGSNRVWQDDPLVTQDSATQGSGSCYTFYADSPEEQSRVLELLNAYNIAFVNSDGDLLTIAKLDTENAFALNGKVTVPIVIDEVATVEKTVTTVDSETGEETTTVKTEKVYDVNGNEIHAIMPLEKNKAELITAIIYINGAMIGNEDVLSASEIEGQLNIQFTSSAALEPASDYALKNLTRSVSASVDKTTFGLDDTVREVTVTVNVEGDAPGAVTAFFQRAINSKQGKRMETMSFAPTENEGEFTASYTFSSPGDYYLREIMLDGVSFDLDNTIKISVEGFAPTSLTWGEANNSVLVYTADSTYNEELTLTFDSSSGIDSASDVRLVFTGDNASVSAKMTYNLANDKWSGSAMFGSSGTYTLEYLMVNGEYYDLVSFNSQYKKEITLSLGISATVYTTEALRDEYESGQTYSKKVTVELYDNNSSPLTELTGVELRYANGSSSTSLVTAPLTWDSLRNRYTGELSITSLGVYSFSSVKISGNTVTRCNSAPVFSVLNPDPIAYTAADQNVDANQISFGSGAYIGPIRIANSESAILSAVVKNGEREFTVTKESVNGKLRNDGNIWFIELPTFVEGGQTTQGGVWTVESITVLGNAYMNDGIEITAESPLVWEAPLYRFSELTTTVSSDIAVTFHPGTTAIGSSSDPFMKSYNIGAESGMYVTIMNGETPVPANKVIVDGEGGVTVTITGNNYSGVLELNSFDGSKWNVSEDKSVQNNGNYNATVILKIGDNTYSGTVVNNNTTYTVTSGDPGPDNITVQNITLKSNVFGKTGDEITGDFLENVEEIASYVVKVTYEDENGQTRSADNVTVPATVTLLYNDTGNDNASTEGYVGGNAYSWDANSALENIQLSLIKNSTMEIGGGYKYKAPDTALLAGEYTISSDCAGKNVSFNSETVKSYQRNPIVTITEATIQAQPKDTVFKNPDATLGVYEAGQEYMTYPRFETTDNGQTQNYISNANYTSDDKKWTYSKMVNKISADGYSVKLNFGLDLMAVTGSGSSARYYWNATLPQVRMTISSITNSGIDRVELVVPNAADASKSNKFVFRPNSSSYKTNIGAVSNSSNFSGTSAKNIRYWAGTQVIKSINAYMSDGSTYTIHLDNTIKVFQNRGVPFRVDTSGDHYSEAVNSVVLYYYDGEQTPENRIYIEGGDVVPANTKVYLAIGMNEGFICSNLYLGGYYESSGAKAKYIEFDNISAYDTNYFWTKNSTPTNAANYYVSIKPVFTTN